MAKAKPAPPTVTAPVGDTSVAAQASTKTQPLVFISHDSRDAALAEHFSNLLRDVSAGALKTFRSSDKKGVTGIEFGAEWYKTIMEHLGNATDVIALLTQHSIGRPWILYEAGVAKGKLDNVVFGVALGVPLEKAVTGPFSQFQNCGDDEDSVTKLVMQLLGRDTRLSPREEMVRQQVQVFLQKLPDLTKMPAKPGGGDRVDETAVVKLFEEVKVLFRDLPEQVEGKLKSNLRSGGRRGRRFHPGMLEEMGHYLLQGPIQKEIPGGESIAWLMFISLFREDLPWLYELGMELFRAIRTGNSNAIHSARNQLRAALHVSQHPIFSEFTGDEEIRFIFTRHLPMMVDDFLGRLDRPQRKIKKLATDSE